MYELKFLIFSVFALLFVSHCYGQEDEGFEEEENFDFDNKIDQEYKEPLFTSYPFTCTNPQHDLIKQINKWFQKQPITTTNPPDWPGEGGSPVVLPEELKEIAEKRYAENQFNIVASEMVALNRFLPDKRAIQ